MVKLTNNPSQKRTPSGIRVVSFLRKLKKAFLILLSGGRNQNPLSRFPPLPPRPPPPSTAPTLRESPADRQCSSWEGAAAGGGVVGSGRCRRPRPRRPSIGPPPRRAGAFRSGPPLPPLSSALAGRPPTRLPERRPSVSNPGGPSTSPRS